MSAENDESADPSGAFPEFLEDFRTYVEATTDAAVEALEEPGAVEVAAYNKAVADDVASRLVRELRTVYDAEESDAERLDRATRLLGGDVAGRRSRELATSARGRGLGPIGAAFEIVEVIKKIVQNIVDLIAEWGWFDDVPGVGWLLGGVSKVLELVDNLLGNTARHVDEGTAERMHATHKEVLEIRALRRASDAAGG